ncbi:MAG: hypothetical protein KF878_08880 [Planctomycetes bacterium]|nr:hypothetical protein [Planctomycetota bacterium]
MGRDWTWKVPDPAANARLHLRYEPGGWGDVLKGVWAVAAAAALARGRAVVRVLDPFAGAPDYPRVAATAARLEGLRAVDDPGVRSFLDLAGPTAAGGPLPSTASLAAAAARAAGARPALEVFDLDPDRRAAWAGRADVLDLASGDEALERPADLVHVDPYDLLADWPRVGPRLAARPPDDPALLVMYAFNRAPRGAAALRDYRAWRADLARALGPRALLVGRVPSDPVLPRAWHEALLAGPPAAVAPLAAPLRAATTALARHLSDAGCFEGPG